MSSEWSLVQHGDFFEQRFLHYLGGAFPAYEVIWRTHVIPLTGRTESGDIQLRQDVSATLVNLCMAHYSVYYHLGFSFELGGAVPSTYFPAVFFHLSAATEMVERFLFSLLILASEEDQSVPGLALLDAGDIRNEVEEYLGENEKGESGYKSSFNEFVRIGKSVGIPIHSMEDAIVSLESIPTYSRLVGSYKEWRKTSQTIRQYRNSFAHNPLIGRMVNASGELCVPRKESLRKYQSWTNLVYNRDPNEFIPLATCIEELRSRLLSNTNSVWLEVNSILNTLLGNKRPAYASRGAFPSPVMSGASGYPPIGQDITYKAGSGLVFLDNRSLQSGTWMDFPGASGLGTKGTNQRT